MKIDFIGDGAADAPLVRLYDFTSDEAKLLEDVAWELSRQSISVAVHRLPFVKSVDDCQLTCEASIRNQGITTGAGTNEFVCRMTAGAWEDIASLIAPFADKAIGYQWLVESPGAIALLLSKNGEW